MNPLLFYEYGLAKPAGLPFISTWKTDNVSTNSSLYNEVKLPLIATGKYDMTVDWGDGSSSYINIYNSPEVTHTYATPGTYTITIKGKCQGWLFANSGDKLKFIEILQWGTLQITYEQGAFWGCANLNLPNVNDLPDLSMSRFLHFTFNACTSLTKINRVNEWDTSKITSLQGTFSYSSFNQDISNWDTSKVTIIMGLFSGATEFNQPLNTWDVSNVTNMYTVFSGTPKFNQPLDMWNTSKVTTMYGIFQGTGMFNQPLNSWDVSNVNDMRSMFSFSKKFNQPLNNWNTSKVVNMDGMFNSALLFDGDISSWDTSNVKDMSSMFMATSGTTTVFNQNINSWNTSNVTNMRLMFGSAVLFNQNIGNWDTSKVTSMESMFSDALAFNQNIGNWNVSNVTNFSSFMRGKTSLNFSSANLDAIYNGWSSRPVKPSLIVHLGTAKYTSASATARAILTGAPNNWSIGDGGITT